MRNGNKFREYVNSLDMEKLCKIFNIDYVCIDGNEENALKEMKKCLFALLNEKQRKEVARLISLGNEIAVLQYLREQLGDSAWEGCRRESGIE